MENNTNLSYSWCMDYEVRSRTRGKDAYFSVHWSPLRQADRWAIAASVPAVGGVFEIYWMDERKRLRLFIVGHARYGGLRSEIRRLTDSELTDNPQTARLLADREIFFRYAATDSAADMADVVWFFRSAYFPENPGVAHSGRYRRIFMDESAPDRVRWVV